MIKLKVINIKKIELNIISIILIETFFLFLFFKYSFMNILFGIVFGIITLLLTKNIKKNKFIAIFLIIISIFLYFFLFYKITLFISFNLLKSYSKIIIAIFILGITLYIASKKYHVFIKICEITFYIIIVIKIISIFLSLPLINFKNLYIDLNFDYHFIFITILIIFLYNSIYYLNNYRLKNLDLILSFINPISIKFITILILGNTLSNLYKYPYINYLQKIKYFNFIERMEGMLCFEYIFCFILTLSFLIINIKKAIKWLKRLFTT